MAGRELRGAMQIAGGGLSTRGAYSKAFFSIKGYSSQ